MTLTLSSATFEAFAVQVRASWAERAALQLHSTYPDYFTGLDVTSGALVPLCQEVERFAARHEVTREREVFRLILVAISMGHRFWQDPRFHGYVANSLGNVDIVPSRRALAMVNSGKTWLRLLWNDDDLGAFADRLTKHLRSNAITGADAIRSILPRHWQIISTADNQRLIDWLSRSPSPERFRAPYQKLANLACALVHGVHWASDPQYPVLASAIDNADDARDLADRLAAIYGRML